MNSLGRHYRDPSDPSNPSCNYEANGVKCTFYTSNEFANIPYPDDISLGPVNPEPNQSSELASILALLNKQREDQ